MDRLPDFEKQERPVFQTVPLNRHSLPISSYSAETSCPFGKQQACHKGTPQASFRMISFRRISPNGIMSFKQEWSLAEKCEPVLTPRDEGCEEQKRQEKFSVVSAEKKARHKPWQIRVKNPFMNCEKIHPCMQANVSQFLDILREDKNVRKAVVFGSSTERRWHSGSDLDIYIVLKEDRNPPHPFVLFPFDLWTNFTVDERMLSEIKKKGVVVYER